MPKRFFFLLLIFTTCISFPDAFAGKDEKFEILLGDLHASLQRKESLDETHFNHLKDYGIRTGLEIASHKNTFMHLACLDDANQNPLDSFKLIQFLLKYFPTLKKHINTTNQEGDTFLHFAALGGNEDIVKTLIDSGSDIHAKNKLGQTPLLAAVSGPNPNAHAIAALIRAGADVNTEDDQKGTPLQWAAHLGQLETVQLLLEKGANPNARSLQDTTPLGNAVTAGHTEIVNLLLEWGADPNQQNLTDGDTPLHLAYFYFPSKTAAIKNLTQKRLVGLLTDKGAKDDIKNKEGRVPSEYRFNIAPESELDLYDDSDITRHPIRKRPLTTPDEEMLSREVPSSPKKGLFIDLTLPSEEEVFFEVLSPLQKEQIAIQATLTQLRKISKIQYTDGRSIPVTVRPTLPDGDCGFHSNDVSRDRFIQDVVSIYESTKIHSKKILRLRELMREVFAEHHLDGIQHWAHWYSQRTDNGHAATWVNDTHLRVLSLVFNHRIFLYHVSPDQKSFSLIEGNDSVIDELTDDSAKEFHLAYVSLLPGQWPTHFERLLLGEKTLSKLETKNKSTSKAKTRKRTGNQEKDLESEGEIEADFEEGAAQTLAQLVQETSKKPKLSTSPIKLTSADDSTLLELALANLKESKNSSKYTGLINWKPVLERFFELNADRIQGKDLDNLSKAIKNRFSSVFMKTKAKRHNEYKERRDQAGVPLPRTQNIPAQPPTALPGEDSSSETVEPNQQPTIIENPIVNPREEAESAAEPPSKFNAADWLKHIFGKQD